MKQQTNQSTQSVNNSTASIQSLRQALAGARSPQQRRKAALAVMDAYSHRYSLYNVAATLDLVQEATAGIGVLPILSNEERLEVRVFCEFTGLLAEAAAILKGVNWVIE